MEPNSAETWVKVFAILNWVSGAFGILLGLLLIFSSSFLGSLIGSYAVVEDVTLGDEATVQAAFTVMLFGFGVLLTILSAVSILIGFGVWWRKPWGRILSIISLWLGMAWMLIVLLSSFAGGDPLDILVQAISFVVVLAISAFFLWLFHKDPTVLGMFGKPVSVKKAAKAKKSPRR